MLGLRLVMVCMGTLQETLSALTATLLKIVKAGIKMAFSLVFIAIRKVVAMNVRMQGIANGMVGTEKIVQLVEIL